MKTVLRTVVGLALAATLAPPASGGEPEQAPAADANKPRFHIHMISGSNEYKSAKSLPLLKAWLEKHYPIRCTISPGRDKVKEFPNLEQLDEADLMLIFCRRAKISGEQLERITKWFQAGKPAIGIRTASHAFQGFLGMDKEVFGGSYRGHGGSEPVKVHVHERNEKHPILTGVEEWQRPGKLYRNRNNARDTILLLTGVGLKSEDVQPLAWARVYDEKKDARVFYTSMGYLHDFYNPHFMRMLLNAIHWTLKKDPPAKMAPLPEPPEEPKKGNAKKIDKGKVKSRKPKKAAKKPAAPVSPF